MYAFINSAVKFGFNSKKIAILLDSNPKNWQNEQNCNSEGRLESVRYGEGTIKIQEIVAILKIPQIGEYVPLVVEGAG